MVVALTEDLDVTGGDRSTTVRFAELRTGCVLGNTSAASASVTSTSHIDAQLLMCLCVTPDGSEYEWDCPGSG
jgi:hypothetical protein